jgi:hypothetical protein
MLRRDFIAAILLTPTPAFAVDPDQKKKGGGPSFLQLPLLSATIMLRSGGRGVITVEVGVDVADDDLRQRAELSQPRLRAAYNQFLSTYVAGLRPGEPVDADYLAGQFQRQTDQVLGGPGAKCLIGSILVN